MIPSDLLRAKWRKTSRSSDGTQGECVELAAASGSSQAVWVRDSKAPSSAVLGFTSSEWAAFVTALKSGDFG